MFVDVYARRNRQQGDIMAKAEEDEDDDEDDEDDEDDMDDDNTDY